MRRPIIAGNWKMNKTIEGTIAFFQELKKLIPQGNDREVIVAPPFTSLYAASNHLNDSNIRLAAQDIFWEKKGAFTGEVSPGMLKNAGCQYAIIGHSERRQYFHENNETVNQKIKSALEEGLIAILCVGESLEERESKLTFSVVESQVAEGLKEISPDKMQGVVIAYEPIWAIGTGKTASTDQAEEVHLHIRKLLAGLFGKNVSESVRILYGGSVKSDNINDLMAKPNIDGALVGGASLDVQSFAKIINFNPI